MLKDWLSRKKNPEVAKFHVTTLTWSISSTDVVPLNMQLGNSMYSRPSGLVVGSSFTLLPTHCKAGKTEARFTRVWNIPQGERQLNEELPPCISSLILF